MVDQLREWWLIVVICDDGVSSVLLDPASRWIPRYSLARKLTGGECVVSRLTTLAVGRDTSRAEIQGQI